MLMAAGLGTRLRPFTELTPKALLPVMGIPCARFAIDSLAGVGVRSVVANVHHHAAEARAGLESLGASSGVRVEISDESPLLLGSTGGVARALPRLGGSPFFLVNADVLCDLSLAQLARAHARMRKRHGVRLTLAVFPGSESGGSYREILMSPGEEGMTEGLISGLGSLARGRPYFIGIAVIEPEAFQGISPDEPSEMVPRVLEPAIREGKAGYFLSTGCWLDIGSPELWAEAHFELMSRMETGHISGAWRHLIESRNLRIGQRMWISRGSRRSSSEADGWAPAYFNDLRDSAARPPRYFGARAILYGAGASGGSEAERFERMIGYRGLFQKLSATDRAGKTSFRRE